MREIPLTQGYVALVDDEDWEWLSRWKWSVASGPHTQYAQRGPARGHEKAIQMHRLILGTAPGLETDHINGDGLDNRRVNLRECTRQENQRNSRSHLGSLSIYKGVSWKKRNQQWQAHIQVDGRKRHLGLFSIEAEAADAYKIAAVIHFGEFAAGVRGDRL